MVTPEALMEQADNTFKLLEEGGIWNTPYEQEEKILALQTRIKNLKKRKPDGGKPPSKHVKAGKKTFAKKTRAAQVEKPSWFEGNLITLHGDHKTPIPFDAVSVDIGSTSRGLLETKGAKKYCIATRPISNLVQRLDQATEELKKRPQPVHVVVIGGGAAGIELSMSIMGRWNRLLGKENIRVTVLDSNLQLLPNETPANQDALLQILSNRGIDICYDCVVEEVEKTRPV
jgi:NADH dehydrogenase FAD-containing subunit